MKKYTEMNHEELLALKKELDKQYEEIKAQGLALDMSRGKPSNAQLDLSMEMMDVLNGDSDLKCETGVDCRCDRWYPGSQETSWRDVRG